MKLNRKFLHACLLLAVVLAMTATTAFASPSDVSSLLKPKHTPVPPVTTTEVSSTDTGSTEVSPTEEVTPAPHGNSDHAKNKDKGNGNGNGNQKANFRGVVAASDATSLTVTLKNGTEVVFTLDANTVIKYPAHFTPTATETATEVATTEAPTEAATTTAIPEGPLPVGAQVSVKAALQSDDTYLALIVMVIPGKPVKVNHVGVITAFTAGESIEITAKDGTVATFKLSETTKYLPEGSEATLKVGDTVTIIMPRVIIGQPWIAMGVVLHSTDGTETEGTEAPEAPEAPEAGTTD